MVLQIEYKDFEGKRVTYAATAPLTIGRRDRIFTPEINLTWDQGVSHRHARLFYDQSTWFVEALTDTRPTRLRVLPGGETILTLHYGVPHELPAEAELVLGSADTMVIHLTQTDAPPDAAPEGESSPPQAASQAAETLSESHRIEILSRLETLGEGGSGLAELLRTTFSHAHSGGLALYQDKEISPKYFFPAGKALVSFTLARRAIASRAAFRWDRTIASTLSQQQSSLTGTTQALYAPIVRGARVLGVLYLHSSTAFAPTDLALLHVLAEGISASPHLDPDSFLERLPSVFVSYSHHDSEFVKRLAADLRRQRVSVWFDERLHSGAPWQAQLASAIRQADAFALVMSPASLTSDYVQWEIGEARKAGKRIFPLWYQTCDHVPPEIDRLHRINLINRYGEGVLELTEELYASRDAGAPIPTPLPIEGKVRILFLAANPRDTRQLRLGEEMRAIDERLGHSDKRGRFDPPTQKWAVRPTDLLNYLQDHKPHIVHFSGHGSSEGQIILENAAGEMLPVSPEALARLFRALKEADPENCPRCVVLNACFTAEQAHSIAEVVGCVVGMTRAVSDSAAIAFAGRFYDSLARAQNVKQAFNLARAEMGFYNEHETPQLLAVGVDPLKLKF